MPNLPRRPSQTSSLPAQAPPAAGDHDLEDPQPPMLCAPGAELCLVGKRALKVKVSCRWIGCNCSSLKGGELHSISPVHDELANTQCRTQTSPVPWCRASLAFPRACLSHKEAFSAFLGVPKAPAAQISCQDPAQRAMLCLELGNVPRGQGA